MLPDDPECICRGNWRHIVRECESLAGKTFKGRGKLWTFFGVVDGYDDYYYGMSCAGELILLSCVGSIEGHGFELVTAPPPPPGTIEARVVQALEALERLPEHISGLESAGLMDCIADVRRALAPLADQPTD